MKMINHNFKKPMLAISLAVSLALTQGVYTDDVQADEGAQANVLMLGASMQFSAPYSVSGLSEMKVQIVTPSDEVVELSSNGGAISWSTSGQPDGEYGYEIDILADLGQAVEGEDQTTVERVGQSSGRFTVSNGLILQDSDASVWLDQLHPSNLVGAVLEWLVPEANAFITVNDSNPGIIFDDTGEVGFEWFLQADDDDFRIYNYDVNKDILQILDDASMKFEMDATSTEIIGDGGQIIVDINENSATRGLVLEPNGDVKLGNTDFTLDVSTGRVGLNTTAPQEEIHINTGGSPEIRFDAGTYEYDVGVQANGNGGDFAINLTTNAGSNPTGAVVSIEDANGYVGIWEKNPDAVLDVKGPNGVAQIRVEDTAGGNNTVGTVINNINNGPASMRFHNSFNNETLIFRTTISGGIAFDNPATVGEIEFAVEKGGRAKFTGDVLVDGVVVHASSRELKENFEAVDAQEVLAKVNALDIPRWNYIETEDKVKHIGPIAEEFYEAFKLGETRKGITSVDSAGIALVAIQGLSQQLVEKDAQIETLNQQLVDNAAQIAALTNRLASVEQVKDDKDAQIVALGDRVNELEQMVMTTLVALKVQESLESENNLSMQVAH